MKLITSAILSLSLFVVAGICAEVEPVKEAATVETPETTIVCNEIAPAAEVTAEVNNTNN